MIEQKLLVFKTIEALKEKGFLEPEMEILPIRDKNSIWNLIVMKCMHSSVKNEAIKIYTSWKRNYIIIIIKMMFIYYLQTKTV